MKIQKLAVLIASGVLVLCVCGVGMTYALLKHVTDEKVNEFAPGTVSQDIVENSDPTPDSSNTIPYDEDGAVKQVEIKNTGDVDTYVRVMLIPGWKANGTAGGGGGAGRRARPGLPPGSWPSVPPPIKRMARSCRWATSRSSSRMTGLIAGSMMRPPAISTARPG